MTRDAWWRRLWRHVRVPLRITGGLLMIVGGIAMLVLPGPGVAAIIAGVLLLAPDSRFSHWVRRKAHGLRQRYWRCKSPKPDPPDRPNDFS